MSFNRGSRMPFISLERLLVEAVTKGRGYALWLRIPNGCLL